MVLKSAQIAVDDMTAESVMDEIDYDVSVFAESEKILKQLANYKGSLNLDRANMGKRYKGENNPIVTIDAAEGGYPVLITVDYGEETQLNNGRTISGVVSIEVSAPRETDGATRTVTYSNCIIDSVQVDGVTIETTSTDGETSRTVSTSSDVTITLADGTVLERTGNNVRNWLEGFDTPMDHSDNRIEITGTISIESSAGYVWTKEIIEPLIKISDCRHPVQGVVQFTQNGTIIATLDYGDGECDNLAILTVDGESVEIELQGNRPEAKVEKYRERAQNKSNGKGKGNNN
jgi:hypothetical protein